ncbi:hypothetical protein [Mesorhizobium sp. M2A.F.Ca.ET.039.01.1.1]|uniref:terminase gpP N-terminus-related DNA-binding protein n=1 Tax=Mesorhizobium sp. M2A.F.Ca.ET.039.01.1.1 TaxID=2496746 RepID=UPI000FCB0400|nr:hypothetical protein [Mesorhizobium sp. M2A.F.Ca.ET.039.01.1.1]RWX72548.1 hypothetical protein EOA24_00720 [Mesorhizobium sp. M2A.F.Ca.ET.039.01.1.1]
MSGDELDHAAVLWLRGWDTFAIARELRLREATVYRNLLAIRNRAHEIKREVEASDRPSDQS